MSDSWKILIGCVMDSLPADIHARRRIAEAMVACVPAKHPLHKDCRELLTTLSRHMILQRELGLVVGNEDSR